MDQNSEEQHEDPEAPGYPRGRGYGNDYMRGGEVFSGYGYSDRRDYVRPRGTTTDHPTEQAPTPPAEDSVAADAASRETTPAGPDRPGPDAPAGTDAPVPEIEHSYGGTGVPYSRSYYVTQAQLQQRLYALPRERGPYSARLAALHRPDSAVGHDVQQALFLDSWVDADRIAVEVHEGVVTLRGTLPNEREVHLACDDAWSVAGVREVRCGIRSEISAS